MLKSLTSKNTHLKHSPPEIKALGITEKDIPKTKADIDKLLNMAMGLKEVSNKSASDNKEKIRKILLSVLLGLSMGALGTISSLGVYDMYHDFKDDPKVSEQRHYIEVMRRNFPEEWNKVKNEISTKDLHLSPLNALADYITRKDRSSRSGGI